jgi:hypothetical protein
MLNGQKRKIEVDKEEADEIIAVNTFKEIKGMKIALGNLATAISQPKEDKAIIDAINKQGDALDKVALAIQNQPKPEKNVTTDNKEILPLLREIKEGQIALKEAFENKLVVSEFNFVYDYGNIRTAKVVYTPMKDIIIKK